MLEMKNYNMILTENQEKYKHYHQIKMIKMNILQAKTYYLLFKEEWLKKAKFTNSPSKTKFPLKNK